MAVALADRRQFVVDHLQQARRFSIVTAAERCGASSQSRCDFARWQAAFADQALEPGYALVQAGFVEGCSFREGGVEIGERKAGAREMPPRMGRDLGPFRFERRRCLIKSPSP